MTPEQIVADLCRDFGPRLNVRAPLDGARVLWGLAGIESSFGAAALPRHEPAYCNIGHGRYDIPALSRRWGCAAHCSYGPWQMMFAHLVDLLPEQLHNPALFIAPAGILGGLPGALCEAAVHFLNSEILGRQGATTMAEIAKAWNHGDWRDQFDDSAYTDRAVNFYASYMPAASTSASTEETNAPAT